MLNISKIVMEAVKEKAISLSKYKLLSQLIYCLIPMRCILVRIHNIYLTHNVNYK